MHRKFSHNHSRSPTGFETFMLCLSVPVLLGLTTGIYTDMRNSLREKFGIEPEY